MTCRRRRLLLFLAAAAVLLVLALPAVHWRLVGWARGEPFFDGRPASYWRREVARCEPWPVTGPEPGEWVVGFVYRPREGPLELAKRALAAALGQSRPGPWKYKA